MKKAFTLIELLVVIGILGILIGTLVAAFGGSTDRARTVKCAAHIRNLAAAAISENYPFAQSAQYIATDISRSGNGICYRTHRGWISYLDQGAPTSLSDPGSYQQCSFASTDEKEKLHALTNGAVWKSLGGNRDTYLCPEFVKECRRAGVPNPAWSYQMNAFFGYEREPGKALSTSSEDQVDRRSRADRRLLFAEIQAIELKPKDRGAGINSLPPVNLTGGNGTPECDSCLLYKSLGGNESMGFNHRRGRQIVGHVAFADGHVETIAAPKNGNYLELTDWLCRGLDVVYKNGDYDEIKNSVE